MTWVSEGALGVLNVFREFMSAHPMLTLLGMMVLFLWVFCLDLRA